MTERKGRPAQAERGNSVRLYNGTIQRIAWAINEGIHGYIVELENGLFVEVVQRAEPDSPVRWVEIQPTLRP